MQYALRQSYHHIPSRSKSSEITFGWNTNTRIQLRGTTSKTPNKCCSDDERRKKKYRGNKQTSGWERKKCVHEQYGKETILILISQYITMSAVQNMCVQKREKEAQEEGSWNNGKCWLFTMCVQIVDVGKKGDQVDFSFTSASLCCCCVLWKRRVPRPIRTNKKIFSVFKAEKDDFNVLKYLESSSFFLLVRAQKKLDHHLESFPLSCFCGHLCLVEINVS